MKFLYTRRFFHQVKGSAVDDGRVFAEGDGGFEGARRVLPWHDRRPRASRRRLGRVRLHFSELVVHHGAVRNPLVAANTRQRLPGPENSALKRIPSQLLTLRKLWFRIFDAGRHARVALWSLPPLSPIRGANAAHKKCKKCDRCSPAKPK